MFLQVRCACMDGHSLTLKHTKVYTNSMVKLQNTDGGLGMSHHVDLIIVNYNTRFHLEQCIRMLQKNTFYPYQLIVIDNASTDDSQEYLKKLEQQGIRVIFNQDNLGTSKAWNQGIRWGSGEYILLLNPDTRVTPGWLQKMVRCAQSDSRVAVVGAKQVDQNGKIIYAGVVRKNGREVPRGRNEQDHPTKYSQPCECTTVSGACYMIKRSLLPKIGYFDERFFMYAEETDYSFRVRLLGYKVLYCPVTIIHYREGAPMNPQRRRLLRQKSDQIYNEKWAGPKNLRFELAQLEVLQKCRIIKGETKGVYVIYKGQRHLISSVDVFNRLGLSWSWVDSVPQKEIEKIPKGITIYI